MPPHGTVWLSLPLLGLLYSITLFTQVSCSGVFELKLESFQNSQGLNADGNCCNGLRSSGKCTSTCRTFFRICLKHYQANISFDPPCTFGSINTPVVGDNSFNFPSGSSKIRLPFTFSWPGTFSLIIEAWHDTTLTGPTQDSPRELITRLAARRSVEVGKDWQEYTHTDAGSSSALRYSYRVSCEDNYYGVGCIALCRPRDDQFGHYSCSPNGTKVCLDGWSGPYCDQAQCLPGCHATQGYCEKPNECKCRLGWQGRFCDTCIPYPGCQHGSCSQPWQCNCAEGWGGLFCNQDLNYCTHHRPCKNGATCTNTGQGSYTCTCPNGFTGTNCEIEIDDCQHQPCSNGGTCVDKGTDYQCQCPPGYNGRHCESNAVSCATSPCKNGATCLDGAQSYMCICQAGFSGINCEVETNECASSPCLNGGRCIDEFDGFRCVCANGYSGLRCQENINHCTINTCLNGGTCLDRVDDFQCRCVPGFVGPLCQTNVDDCLTLPCANGGTCHDLVNDFMCTCAPGFSGKDCSINVNECARRPCQNGGHCNDLVNDYECSCLKGYWGKNCQFAEGDNGLPHTPDTKSVESSTTTTVSSSSTVAATAGGSDGLVGHQGKEDASLTLEQLLLIVCLGVGIPIVIIIIIIAFLLCKKSRRHNEDHMKKQNEQNEVKNMNNKYLDTNIINSIPPSNVCIKITNEENDSKTYKTKQHLNRDKTSNKNLITDFKELNTNELLQSSSRDYEKPCKKGNIASPDDLSIETAVDISEYQQQQSQVVVKPNNNKDTNSNNSLLYLEKKNHRPHFSEAMLATEV